MCHHAAARTVPRRNGGRAHNDEGRTGQAVQAGIPTATHEQPSVGWTAERFYEEQYGKLPPDVRDEGSIIPASLAQSHPGICADLVRRCLKVRDANPEMSVRDAEQQAVGEAYGEMVAALKKLSPLEEGASR